MDKIYVFGHKKPDTDSVCSAIVLSYLKNKLGFNTEARILGDINSETAYALKKFGFKKPEILNDVKLQIKDVNYLKNINFNYMDSIFNAYKFMNKNKVSMLPIVDDNNKLYGIVSMKDIASNLIDDSYALLDTTYDNILNTIDGKEVIRFDENIKGEIRAASYQHQTLIETADLNEKNILIVGDRNKVIEHAIEKNIKLLVLTGGAKLKDEHLDLAKKNKVNVIQTNYDTFKTTRYISFADHVSSITLKDGIILFNENDFVTDFTEIASNTRYSNFPIVDDDGICLGLLKLADIKEQKKKQVILVDHNELKQSADGLNEANILEVIDHHNIGNIGTSLPISFRTMPVGCTNTILFTLFEENNVEIPKNIAGLMISAIVSDTLLLKSPTTTSLDREVLQKLSKMSGIDWEQYGYDMLKAGSSLKGKTKEEVLYSDFKNFQIDEHKMGIGQISTFNIDEFLEDKDSYIKLIDSTATNNEYDILALFVTDIIKNGSYIFYNTNAEELIKEAYNLDKIEQGLYLDGVVSRKKQMAPYLMDILKRK